MSPQDQRRLERLVRASNRRIKAASAAVSDAAAELKALIAAGTARSLPMERFDVVNLAERASGERREELLRKHRDAVEKMRQHALDAGIEMPDLSTAKTYVLDASLALGHEPYETRVHHDQVYYAELSDLPTASEAERARDVAITQSAKKVLAYFAARTRLSQAETARVLAELTDLLEEKYR